MAPLLKRSVCWLLKLDFSRQFLSIYHRSKGVFFSTASSPFEDELKAMYEKYLVDHGKSYKTAHEKQRRFEIFKKTLRFINEYNSTTSDPSRKLGITSLADVALEEISNPCVQDPAPWPMGT
ncbi:hypothetical protein SSX86_010120 [Deinandra increscens subsp. villosa]|uniref:Cathepsin propeptide inhibitor domain-containing protein n=1 Tax=Deinandra increscens subsp. villosa TaxID=3103831 RepID=A0AAP0D8F3_9ASTR